ncbi:hypothetical protein NQ314_006730 [Rhamnusium bicolor]|uniref:CCHC-type domain-containing protein n=1 Tax=Rhamnusium bicolor TaxID=1586634 RepID=A0AAV8YXS8_9CUCU|nr:hypothetical protein NQ314_006730 [Rhamnusium bicolor]
MPLTRDQVQEIKSILKTSVIELIKDKEFKSLFLESLSDMIEKKLQEQKSEYEEKIKNLEEKIDTMEQYSRRKNFQSQSINLRSGRNLPQSQVNFKTVNMSDEIRQVVMTPEMLQNLIANLGQPATGAANQGNFSKCTHRFDGSKNQDVHAFIDSINVYKDCLQISDINALKGFPMLLEGQATIWWKVLRKQPLIYRELFAREQREEEKTDIFVSRCRALLSHLPSIPVLPESIQLDMVYVLLHFKIREKIPRDSLTNFEELIEEARKAEITLQEINTTPTLLQQKTMTKAAGDTSKLKPKKQCVYCKAYGHVREECRKLSRKKAEMPTNTNNTLDSEGSKTLVTCFGCGAIGYIRSNCPTCKSKSIKSELQDIPSDFRYYSTSGQEVVRPLVSIEIEKLHGTAILDTGAKTNMPRHCWYFGEDLTTPYPFIREANSISDNIVNMVSLRENEGSSLTSTEVLELNSTLQKYQNIFKPSAEASPFAEHCIRIIDALEETSSLCTNDAKCCSKRGYLMSNGILYRYIPEEDEDEPQLVVPRSAIVLLKIAREAHEQSQDNSKMQMQGDAMFPLLKSPIFDKPEIPLGKYHISALTPYHGTEEHVPMQPLRRRGRPPKLTSKPSVNVSNSVSNDSPAEVSQPSAQKIGNTPSRKPYLLRAPKPKPPWCVESRTGRTRDSKGEIFKVEFNS